MNVSINPIDLADLYGLASIDVDSNAFTARLASVKAIADRTPTETCVDLARAAMGLPAREVVEEFVAKVRTDDPSFSASRNKREIELLAVAVLEQRSGPERDDLDAIFAVLAVSAHGQRTCQIDENLVARMEGRRRHIAVRGSALLPPNTVAAKEMSIGALEEDVKALSAKLRGNIESADEITSLFQSVEEASDGQAAALATTVQARLAGFRRKFEQQQSEIDLLWWLYGQWSTALDVPLADCDPAKRSALVGFDLGNLSDAHGGPGPVAAFVKRAMGTIPKTKSGASLQRIVGLFDNPEIEAMGIDAAAAEHSDVMPLLGTLRTRLDRKAKGDDAALYEDLPSLDPARSYPFHEWGEQVYRETVLLRRIVVARDE